VDEQSGERDVGVAKTINDSNPVPFEDRSSLGGRLARHEEKGEIESLGMFDELPRGCGVRSALELDCDRLLLIAEAQDGVGSPVSAGLYGYRQTRDVAEDPKRVGV
jgi:hypothetical protein